MYEVTGSTRSSQMKRLTGVRFTRQLNSKNSFGGGNDADNSHNPSKKKMLRSKNNILVNNPFPAQAIRHNDISEYQVSADKL